MSNFKIVCSICGQTFIGNSEYDQEIEYNNHKCIENGRTLHNLTEEKLIQIIKSEKKEEEVRKEKTIKKGSPYNKPTGQALQAERDVPGPCPWINPGRKRGAYYGSKSQTENLIKRGL